MIQFAEHERNLRILVVENVAHMAKIIRDMLRSMGFCEVHRVTNVVHAFQFVVKNRPDLIVAEVNMAPLGGDRLCKALRLGADSPDRTVPIVLTLAEATIQTVAQARDAGAHAVLAKPLSPAALSTKIAAVLRSPQPFVPASNYTGPDRRRRSVMIGDDKRRPAGSPEVLYPHPVSIVFGLEAGVLSGALPLPLDFVNDDDDRHLNPGAPPRLGHRKLLISQLREGMELAEPIIGPDNTPLIPKGILVCSRLIAMLVKLTEKKKIAPYVQIVA